MLAFVTWACVVFAFIGCLYRYESFYLYHAATLVGALVGTGHAAILRQPEKSRWTHSFYAATLFGGVAYLILSWVPQGGLPKGSPFVPWAWILDVICVFIPACFCASITELLRIITDRLAGKT